MPDITRLVVEVDSDGVVKAVKNFEDFKRQGKEVEDATRHVKESFTEMNQTLELMKKGFELLVDPVREMISKFVEAEPASIRLQAIWTATGGVLGQTMDDLKSSAEQLAKTSIFDDDQLRNAQAIEMTFSSLRSDAFEPTVKGAGDLASAFGGDLTSRIQALGKASEEGASGLTALKRSGVILSDEQTAMIQSLYDSGKASEAWALTLKDIEGKVGGVAQAMEDSRSGSWIKFNQMIEDGQKAAGGWILTMAGPFLDSLTAAGRAMLDNDTSASGMLRRFREMEEASQGVVGSLRDQNSQNVISATQYSQLIGIYPQLAGQITAYATSVSDAAEKVRALNDANKESITIKLRNGVVDDSEAMVRNASSLSPWLTLWNKQNPKNTVSEDLRDSNLETVRNQMAAIEQRNKDSGMTLLSDYKAQQLKDSEREIDILIQIRDHRADLNRQLDSYLKTGELPSGPKGTGGYSSSLASNDGGTREGVLWFNPYKASLNDSSRGSMQDSVDALKEDPFGDMGKHVSDVDRMASSFGSMAESVDKMKADSPFADYDKADAESASINRLAKDLHAMGMGWDDANANAKSFSATMEDVNSKMKSLAIQDLAQGFQTIGQSLVTGSDGGQLYLTTLEQMGIEMSKQIGLLLLTAGVNALIPPLGNWLNPVGWALIAAGGGLEMAGGMGSAAMSASKSQPTTSGVNMTLTGGASVNDAIITKTGQVIHTHPDDNLYAFKQLPSATNLVGRGGDSSPIAVQLINQGGQPMQATAQQSNGPDGRQLLIMLKPMVRGLLANGDLDQAARMRWGVRNAGVSAS